MQFSSKIRHPSDQSHTFFSLLHRPPEWFRNMTLWGCKARDMAAVTSVESSSIEQPRPSLPTGQITGIVPQSRLHWRRLVSTATEGAALYGRERKRMSHLGKRPYFMGVTPLPLENVVEVCEEHLQYLYLELWTYHFTKGAFQYQACLHK